MNAQGEELKKVFQHLIQNTCSPQSVKAIYKEYHGLGDYLDVPVTGGFAALEKKWGNKWRVGNAAYQKAFSQVQLIVKCVDSQITEEKDQETVLEQMDKLFQEKECKTLQHFRSALEVMGLLPKQKVQSAGCRWQPTN